MKRIVLFLALAGTSFAAMAQSIEIVDPMTEVIGSLANPDDEELDAHWGVTNSSSAPITVQARREVLVHAEPWNNPFMLGNEGFIERFCWGPLCYNYGAVQSSPNASMLVTIQPGETNETFHGYYEHKGVAGVTQIRYCFFEFENPDNEVCQDVLFCVDADCVVSVPEQPEFTMSNISPNPIQGVASFNYALPAGASNGMVRIYNMVGAVVKEIALNNSKGMVFINAEDFENGVYFYTLSTNTQALVTHKFVVSK